jgi:hypothetical protein
MLERILSSLYAHLLRLYPGPFQRAFAEEMGEVFLQALRGLEEARVPPVIRRVKMVRLFFRELWSFPQSYLDARRYQASPDPAGSSTSEAGIERGQAIEAKSGRSVSWGEALLGALPFLLFGLVYLGEGIAELGGELYPGFNLQEISRNFPSIRLPWPVGVYFFAALGLLFGVWKGFPRWSFAYLGMSGYFGWYYGNGRFYGVVYGSWAWLPLFVAVLLGLLLARSLRPLVQLLREIWEDWTLLSFVFYTAFLPMLTVIFFDSDWGVPQLYWLVFDTALLAAGAVAFLRSRQPWTRVGVMEAVVLVLVVKGMVQSDWHPSLGEQLLALNWTAYLFILIYFGFLLLPGVIGLVRSGVKALSAR